MSPQKLGTRNIFNFSLKYVISNSNMIYKKY